MDRSIRNAKPGPEPPSLGLRHGAVLLQPCRCPSGHRGPASRQAGLTHLITLTRSWKALSTLRGGSLALVSMYGIWKAKQRYGVPVTALQSPVP